jgi:2'-5' RNA ligase
MTATTGRSALLGSPQGDLSEDERARLVSYPDVSNWLAWQRAYHFGLLVIVPPPQIASVLDAIRERLDPVSAATFGAHITVTPPFIAAPSAADEERVEKAIRGEAQVRLQLDRPTQFSGSSVVYLPVVPSEGVHALRTTLLATGLFRLDQPHTSDFVPHLTLSEFGSAPEEALGTNLPPPEAMAFVPDTVAWVVPDEAFHFKVHRTFRLS